MIAIRVSLRASLFSIALAALSNCLHGQTQSLTQAAAQPAASSYGRLPLSFEENRGQTAAAVKFVSRGAGYGLFLTGNEAVLTLSQPTPCPEKSPATGRAEGNAAAELAGRRPSMKGFCAGKPAAAQGDVVRMQLEGASRNPAVAGVDALPGKANYFIGNDPAKWTTGVPTYAKVRYAGVYPGVDLVYYGNQRQLEYDFVVAPGADPKAIQLRFAGAKRLQLTAAGDLAVIAKNGSIAFHKPVLYQEFAGQRRPVGGRFTLAANHRVGFLPEAYDRSLPLVIDPVLAYSTYLGGSGTDQGYAIAVDSTGAAYVTGDTTSMDFPTTSGSLAASDPESGGVATAFIAKISSSGQSLAYSTYLGGTGGDYEGGGGDHARGIAVDSSGNAYIVGYTGQSGFPVTSRAYQKTPQTVDAFVTKLNPSGSALAYSTLLGGCNYDFGFAIAVDKLGIAFVTGTTFSNDFNIFGGDDAGCTFPVTAGAYQQTNNITANNQSTGFVTRLSSDGSSLAYSTYLGGSGINWSNSNSDGGTAIAIDAEDNAYVTGYTASLDFPTVNALQGQNNTSSGPKPGYNAFVTKLNSAGTALSYSTYLGGSGSFDSAHNLAYSDQGNSIQVDAQGDAFIAGITGSHDFPVSKGAYLTANPEIGAGGFRTGFVTELNPAGSAKVYSTYLGGTGGQDWIAGLALDSSGDAHLAGWTSSDSFPVTPGAYFSKNPGQGNLKPDPFVAKLNPSGTSLLYATYFGGSDGDEANAIAVDASGAAYFTGYTNSVDFPLSAKPLQNSNNTATYTGFVAKLEIPASATPTATTTTLSASANPATAGVSVTFTATVTGAGSTAYPAGTVSFALNGGTPVVETLNGSGVAVYTTTLTTGSYKVTASYGGSATFTASSASLTETVNEATVATPTFSPAGGTYTSALKVAIADATAGATIYYTTNKTTPTTSSAKYAGPIAVSATETIEAIAVLAGDNNSAVATVAYSIVPVAAAPVFSVPAGTYEAVQLVAIASATPGATIYYTTNGTAPTAASAKYAGPIAVASSETVDAIAVATGYANGSASAAYVIVGSPAALAGPATAVTATGATLNAIVNAEGLAGSYSFAYGTSASALTKSTAAATLAASTEGVAASASLTGLTANTTYYFKVTATTAGGTATGAIQSFTTP